MLRSTSITFLSTAALFLLAVERAHGHNWMESASREVGKASTTKPFKQRSQSDTHAQLGPGQRMAVKFATGHNKFHYFALFSSQDQGYAYFDSYLDMVKDYIGSAPSSANVAAQNPRLHRCNHENCPDGVGGVVNPDDNDYCDHPHYSSIVHRYTSSLTRDDQMVFYKSAKYPWLLGAIRYENLNHAPNDADVFCMPVPFQQGKGHHYMLHWIWRGYYDVVDVHAFEEEIPTDEIYGKKTSSFEFNRVDHCQFFTPQRLAGPAREATETVSSCKNDAIEAILSAEADNTVTVNLMAINVVPTRFDDTSSPKVLHPFVNGPWTPFEDVEEHGYFFNPDYIQYVVSGSAFELEGTVTSTSIDYERFLNRGVSFIHQKSCKGVPTNARTFIDATNACLANSNCQGVTHLAFGNSNSSMAFVGEHEFRLCTGAELETKTGDQWNVYHYDPHPAPTGMIGPSEWTDSNHFVLRVSFVPDDPAHPVALPNSWYQDNGKTFGTRNDGFKYGWKCRVEHEIVLSSYDQDNTGPETGQTVKNEVNKLCNGTNNYWEAKVPNGLYAVTIHHGGSEYGADGCYVEGHRVRRDNGRDQARTFAFRVNVRDGRLTLGPMLTPGLPAGGTRIEPQYTKECAPTSWIVMHRIANGLPPAMMPSHPTGSQAWKQLELGSSDSGEGVGYVKIALPGMPSAPLPSMFPGLPYTPMCTDYWFYMPGAACQDGGRAKSSKNQHIFDLYERWVLDEPGVEDSSESGANTLRGWWPSDKRNHGAIVSVSDTPCTEEGGCPSGTGDHICEVVHKTNPCLSRNEDMCPHIVDCKGAKGKYVRVQLRGQDRHAYFKLNAYRRKPKLSSPVKGQPKLCYALQPRKATFTFPEKLISTDPTDPIFYSTCYYVQKKIDWRSVPAAPQEDDGWVFEGSCLDCDSFNANVNEIDELGTPNWFFDSNCIDCTKKPSFQVSVNAPPDSSSDPFPSRNYSTHGDGLYWYQEDEEGSGIMTTVRTHSVAAFGALLYFSISFQILIKKTSGGGGEGTAVLHMIAGGSGPSNLPLILIPPNSRSLSYVISDLADMSRDVNCLSPPLPLNEIVHVRVEVTTDGRLRTFHGSKLVCDVGASSSPVNSASLPTSWPGELFLGSPHHPPASHAELLAVYYGGNGARMLMGPTKTQVAANKLLADDLITQKLFRLTLDIKLSSPPSPSHQSGQWASIFQITNETGLGWGPRARNPIIMVMPDTYRLAVRASNDVTLDRGCNPVTSLEPNAWTTVQIELRPNDRIMVHFNGEKVCQKRLWGDPWGEALESMAALAYVALDEHVANAEVRNIIYEKR